MLIYLKSGGVWWNLYLCGFPLYIWLYSEFNFFWIVFFLHNILRKEMSFFLKPQILAVHFRGKHNKNSGQVISEKHTS